MKNILVFSASLLLSGLAFSQAEAQRRPLQPSTSAVAPLPNNPVQPIPKPAGSTRDNTGIQTPAPSPDPYFSRPAEPIGQPSIDRIYQNRMEVDNLTPEAQPSQPMGPPPSTMQPEQAPNRPGTIGGTGNQGSLNGDGTPHNGNNP